MSTVGTGGGDHPDRAGLAGLDRGGLQLADAMRELRLQGNRKLIHLVEVQAAATGAREPVRRRFLWVGAVDLDERPPPPRTAAVQGRGQFHLLGAEFAAQQHRQLAGGSALDELLHPLQRVAGADQQQRAAQCLFGPGLRFVALDQMCASMRERFAQRQRTAVQSTRLAFQLQLAEYLAAVADRQALAGLRRMAARGERSVLAKGGVWSMQMDTAPTQGMVLRKLLDERAQQVGQGPRLASLRDAAMPTPRLAPAAAHADQRARCPPPCPQGVAVGGSTMRTSDGSGFPNAFTAPAFPIIEWEFQEKRDDNHVNIQIAAPNPRVGGPLHHQEIVLSAGRGAAPAISGQRAAPDPYPGAASGRHNPRPTKEIQRMEHTSPAAPKNYLMWAILSIFGGFWPFGIVATVYANRTRCAG
ncbi:hypothetical protein G6F68_010142 [Rhizopus microsporus]|nr:hypothetical protein G6F68_010142 [Rhizopus microsporus]